jgi:hypothetical protein
MKRILRVIILLASFTFSLTIFAPMRARANMAAPFGCGSTNGNAAINPLNALEVKKETINFKIGGLEFVNGADYLNPEYIFADISYRIVNTENDALFTFIFPAVNPERISNHKYEFSIKQSGKEIPYKVMNEYEIKNFFEKNIAPERLNELILPDSLYFIDPLKGKEYTLKCKVSQYNKVFFVFKIFLKKDVETEINVNFKSRASFDNMKYPKTIYSYFYLLNVRDFYKAFKNIKVRITYPQSYVLKTNFDNALLTDSDGKKTLIIKPQNNFGNLVISYIPERPSSFSLFLYSHFKFLFEEGFWMIVIVFVLPVLFVLVAILLILFFIKRKRKAMRAFK